MANLKGPLEYLPPPPPPHPRGILNESWQDLLLDMNWDSPLKKGGENANILSNKEKRTLDTGMLKMFLVTVLSYCMLWKIRAKFLNLLYFIVYTFSFPCC